MARFFDPTYDPRQDSGTSGVEVSDLNPEQSRDVDLRRLDEEERDQYADIVKEFGDRKHQENAQSRISKYMAAAKTAGAYRQRSQISEPGIRGQTPRSEAVIDGVQLPSLGDTVGTAGSTNYARKPSSRAGMFRGF